jgi:hypothetical protein
MSKQLMRKWLSRSLPSLKQGSTLSIRSKAKNTHISIRPEWRDTGYLSVLHNQQLGGGAEPNLQILKEEDQMTSMGRHESHISILLNDSSAQLFDPSLTKGTALADEEAQSNNNDFPENIVVLDDATVVADSPEWSPPPNGYKRIDYSDGVVLVTKENETEEEPETMLSLNVPEKLNIDCNLENGGSIQIHDKIEGDVKLKTSDGDIMVKKLRGHVLDIKVLGEGNSIYSPDLLEAGTLYLSAPASGRFRAKRIHAGSCNIKVGMDGDTSSPPSSGVVCKETFDVDDSGAICDISSLYVTKDANVNYHHSINNDRQPIRIKSHHGHVIVDATAPKPTIKNEMTDQYLSIVDLGGVNGSCEVYVQEPTKQGASAGAADDDGWVSCHVHFDSILPDSVSVLKTTIGDVQITVDRKVESDLRFLSAANLSSLHLDHLMIDSGDEDFDILKSMLTAIDNNSSSSTSSRNVVNIQTKAFTDKSMDDFPELDNCQLVDGWIENRSEEPDSRFDRKVRGDAGSVGKIRLEGAETQALRGFQKPEDNEANAFPRPIVAVASTGKISLETLSWLGNIARRYGLDDKRETDDLGRTAARRGRSLGPSDE